MARDYRLISSDSHLEVRPERWVHRVAEKYRDRAPRTIRLPDGGDGFLIEGQPIREIVFLDNRAGRSAEEWRPFGMNVEDTAGTGPPEQRVQEMDVDGIDAEVLFPSQNAGPSLWRNISHDEVYKGIVRGYNDWLGEEYCPVSPDRLLGLGVIPMTNVDDAIAELEHCAKLGLAGVHLWEFPSGRGYPTPDDDRFWAAAVDIGMPVTVHVALRGPERGPGKRNFVYPREDPEIMNRIKRNFVEWVANFGLECSMSLSQLVLSGVFDRHPGLKLFFAETRLGWVPFWLESADLWYQRHLPWAQEYLGFQPLEQLPSDYIRQHILWSIQYERVPLEIRHRLNVEHIMFASDFPHIECEWPHSRQTLDRVYTDIPEDEKQKLWAGNAVRFFKLDQPASTRLNAREATTA